MFMWIESYLSCKRCFCQLLAAVVILFGTAAAGLPMTVFIETNEAPIENIETEFDQECVPGEKVRRTEKRLPTTVCNRVRSNGHFSISFHHVRDGHYLSNGLLAPLRC